MAPKIGQRHNWYLPALPKTLKEAFFLVCAMAVAGLLVVRVGHFRQQSTFTATLRSTTRVHSDGRLQHHREPSSTTITELVINSGLRKSGRSRGAGDRGRREKASSDAVDQVRATQQEAVGASRRSRGDEALGGSSQGATENQLRQRDGDGRGGGGESGRGTTALRGSLDSQTAAKDGQENIHLPRDFDWQTYLLYHPDLRLRNVTLEHEAEAHYMSEGRAEGRVYKRLRVVLRYTACTGLINQHYSHIAAFSLAAVLGAEIVLPPAAKRDSFAHYFSVFKEHNEVSWTAAPLESLLDVEKLVERWRAKGLSVHKVRWRWFVSV